MAKVYDFRTRRPVAAKRFSVLQLAETVALILTTLLSAVGWFKVSIPFGVLVLIFIAILWDCWKSAQLEGSKSWLLTLIGVVVTILMLIVAFLTMLLWVPVGILYLPVLGFLYEIWKPSYCLHRARPLRCVAIIIGLMSMLGFAPTLAWTILHFVRKKRMSEKLKETFLADHTGYNWSVRPDCFLGVGNPFAKMTIRSAGSTTISGLNYQNTLKSKHFLESDSENDHLGYGNIVFKVKSGAAHQAFEQTMRIPSPRIVCECLNRIAGEAPLEAE